MSDLALWIGCNLSSPRTLCLILLIREWEKRVNPLCVLCRHYHPPPLLSLIYSTNYWITRHTSRSHQKHQHTCAATTNIRLMVTVTQPWIAQSFVTISWLLQIIENRTQIKGFMRYSGLHLKWRYQELEKKKQCCVEKRQRYLTALDNSHVINKSHPSIIFC